MQKIRLARGCSALGTRYPWIRVSSRPAEAHSELAKLQFDADQHLRLADYLAARPA